MDRKVAKELTHIRGWLNRAEAITRQGKRSYLADDLLQEAGDSIMMKLGEAANRLSKLGTPPPDGVDWSIAVANRNFIIHQYDVVDREQTWLTLSVDLPAWQSLLRSLFEDAETALKSHSEAVSGKPASRHASAREKT